MGLGGFEAPSLLTLPSVGTIRISGVPESSVGDPEQVYQPL